ncbi:hypothetical protein BJ138DRAFT_939978 [Hygrophoropsis aurantiaca]|uniref:Uncharacterized protein n=1 Tax=Hygrophoropsis aurantiaca TaxID=72124 RepID=A0ACB8AEK3_9AGAM|nr:hypothetical protein BJ138DRAFT_939978 [Hygrophoropsis aurantiaca]
MNSPRLPIPILVRHFRRSCVIHSHFLLASSAGHFRRSCVIHTHFLLASSIGLSRGLVISAISGRILRWGAKDHLAIDRLVMGIGTHDVATCATLLTCVQCPISNVSEQLASEPRSYFASARLTASQIGIFNLENLKFYYIFIDDRLHLIAVLNGVKEIVPIPRWRRNI